MSEPRPGRRAGTDKGARQAERAERRSRWDARHAAAEPIESGAPNPVLIEETERLPPGRALDLGSGDGRNAVWLARRGWQVSAVDFSPVALARARQLAEAAGVSVDWHLADLVEFEPPPEAFNLVTLFFIHLPAEERRTIHAAAAAALAPGGVLLVVGHDRSNLGQGVGGPQDPAVLFTPAEIAAEFPGLTVERAEVIRRPGTGERGPIDAVVRAVRPRR